MLDQKETYIIKYLSIVSTEGVDNKYWLGGVIKDITEMTPTLSLDN